ncbi:nucleoside phosphorylase [Peribacillus loiseleuriae]|uniref:Uridine phosphorylase n=1 Tax=Peribacillus loiseleuriae TaxID=1679170 RepID=A0A0K9GZ30_9BACI|nr:nucleoside phosphorylase [Peribacillus loiseleuriae]KMY51497.1 uridine phosphorylase [Peribacillus loiseleuriae]
MKLESTLYLQSTKKDIAKYVIFSGDPRRVEKIITLMEDVEKVSINREYHTYTGFYKGVRVTVTSTGIGGPSAAIALEEMYECGMEVAVRLGTVMGLKSNLGQYIIPKAAMRKEATSHTYVDSSFPAVADHDLVSCMNQSVLDNEREYENGIVCSMDGYYTEMKESRLSRQMERDVPQGISELHKYNISGIDMESGVVLTLSNLMNIRGCVVTLATVLDNLKEMMESNLRIKEEAMLAKIVLDGLVLFHKEDIKNNESI